MNEDRIILKPEEFLPIFKKSVAVKLSYCGSFYHITTEQNGKFVLTEDSDKGIDSIEIPDVSLAGPVEYDPKYKTYSFVNNPNSIEPFKLLSLADSPFEQQSDTASVNSLDYYPNMPEGTLYCIGGADVVKKKALAIKMRELSMEGCPYLIIDSANSRHFISHCVGHDIITALANNTRIAEVAEMVIKQGLSVIVLTARSEIVYILLKDKLSNVKIVDVASLDIDAINSESDIVWQ